MPDDRPACILVIEDDAAIRAGMVAGLELDGHQVRAVATAADARRAMAGDGIDLIVLDLVLPGGDGLDLLAALRVLRPERPVLIVSARGGVDDRVRGLRDGADDYLVKPFGLAELRARVAALLRRAGVRLAPAGGILRWPGGEADLARRRARTAAGAVELTAHEDDLLRFLVERRDRAVPRAELHALLWRCAPGMASRAVDMAVQRLREKLGDPPGGGGLIDTVRGVGYRLGDAVAVP